MQLLAERLLALTRDAFQGQDGNSVAVERQLIGFFVDCLHHDYLRMKVMRDNPDNFHYAVQAALHKKNLRKRFQIRSGCQYGPVWRYNEGRTEEPMDVDHYRPPK